MKLKKGNKKTQAETSAPAVESASSEIDSIFSTDEFDMDFSSGEADDSAKVKKKISLKSIFNIRNLVIFVCMITFCVCVIILVGRWFDYKRSDDIYLTLSESIFKEVSDDPSVISTTSPMLPEANINNYDRTLWSGVSTGQIAESTAVTDIEYARIKAKLEELKAVNDDIVGWIKIDGTQVNYPVVIGDDNDYYLSHAYNGEYLRSGTIFVDYRSSAHAPTDNYNYVFYGHNMANGAMFATVKKFLKEEMFNEKLIYYYTLNGVYVYEPFAMLNTDTSFYYYQIFFQSNDQYEAFLGRMLENSIFKKDVELTADDRIISLSTCNNSRVTGRYCLQARLIRVENKK